MMFADYIDDLGRPGLQFETIIGVELNRLRLVLTDIQAWGLSVEVRLLSTKQANEVVYGFADGTRAFLTFEQLPQNRVRIRLHHDNSAAATLDYQAFWQDLIGLAKKRLTVEPLAVATAPAKLNIFFKVGNRKADGYHDVVSIYQELSIRETVIVSTSHDWSLAISGTIPEEHLLGIPLDGNNLAFKAVKFLAEKANLVQPLPVAIGIDKNAPVAGGMGGGSADAAATLMALNDHWQLQISREELVDSAVALGADVPFVLQGGTALAHGVGEQLKPLELGERLHWVVIPSQGGLSTPEVFNRLDELREAAGTSFDDANYLVDPHYLIDALAEGNPFDIAEFMQNDLQDAALDLMPSLAISMQDGVRCGAIRAMVSGSGPTVVLLAGSAAAATEIASQMRILGYEALIAHSDDLGAVIES
jgi:4-diphosphocytidyl-2-C-methyl-D-erythritol kinase